MTEPPAAPCYRFGVFEADASTGELRRQGVRIKLNAQPFQMLLLFLGRPGEILTREGIARELWPEGIFVDYEHGVNSAVNRIREALGDTASNPRFIETLARRGYRFVAPVERFGEKVPAPASPTPMLQEQAKVLTSSRAKAHRSFLATTEDLPKASFPSGANAFHPFAVDVRRVLCRRPCKPHGNSRPLLGPTVCNAVTDDHHRYRSSPYPCPCLLGMRGAFSCTQNSRTVWQALAAAFASGCALVALTFPAVAPHQLRPGSVLHGTPGVFTFRAAFANADGRGQGGY